MDASQLSRRERQIMETVYAHADTGLTAEAVVERLDDPPTRTAVRTFLRILEDKGILRHEKQGRAFLYRPARPVEKAGKGALKRVIETFFGGSVERALAAHLADPRTKLTPEEVERLSTLVREAGQKAAT
jgi:BlaI family penicillinase repressor